MARQILITVDGNAGSYTAMVAKIQEQNRALYSQSQQGAAQTVASLRLIEGGLGTLQKAFAGAFGFSAILAFGKSIVSLGGQIQDLSDRTGISTKTLSGIRNSLQENGVSLDQFASAIQKAQKNLGALDEDGAKASVALQVLGLNTKELIKVSPDEFLKRFAAGLATVENQNRRTAIAAAVLGKGGQELAFVLADLSGKLEKLKETGLSEATIASVDRLGDSFTRFFNRIRDGGITVIGALNLQLEKFFNLTKEAQLENQKLSAKESVETLNFQIENVKKAPGFNFGLFKSGDEREAERLRQVTELIKRRNEALERFETLTHELIALENPPKKTGGDDELEKRLAALAAQKKAAEDAKKLAAEAAQFVEQLKKQANDSASAFEKLSDPMEAARIQIAELEEKAAKFNNPTMRNLIETIKLYTVAVIEKNKEDEKQKQIIEQVTELNKFLGESEAAEIANKEKARSEIEQEFQLKRELLALDIDRLRAAGLENEARKQELENIIALNEERKKRLTEAAQGGEIFRQPGEIAKINKEIQNAQTAMGQLGEVTINIGQQISRSVTDIFAGLISGTLKASDVGKSVLATIGRTAAEFFAEVLNKKLGFENIIFSNLRGFTTNATQALSAGGGSGGLINMLLFGSGGPEQLSGPPEEGGGGLLGGLFGAIKNMLGGFGGGIGGLVGSAGSFLSDLIGGGPQQLSGPSGGGGGFGIGNIFSILSTTASGIINSTAIGSTISTAVIDAITSIVEIVSTTVSSTLTSITSTLASIPGIGWIAAAVVAVIGGIYRIIANQQERPNARFSGQFEGVAFDELSKNFLPGSINVGIGRKVGIKNSAAGSIADSLQQRLLVLQNQFVNLLNIFPDFVSNDIIPALETTNARLAANFSNLKFSPAGRRTIQQELEAMSGPDGLVRFFQAFQPALAVGFNATLNRAGVGNIDTTGFQSINPGFRFPQEDWTKFIQAIKDTAGITSALATQGASKFLTPDDLAGVGSIFTQLFSTSDPKAFTELAGKLTENLKPVTDFLTQSMTQASELFGKGLIAAMEAVTESDAKNAFFNSLSSGIKDTVFQGLTGAFIASAQFTDLLAPVQQTIRDFVQKALASGETPDLGAFQSAILPDIEEIVTRAKTLEPLVASLQQIGLLIKGAISGTTEPVKVITQSMIDSTQLFGQGLIAANAAKQSSAKEDFLRTLGEGTRDIIFKGITEAFLASSQFEDLLGPIQSVIKDFVSQAVTSGELPDLAGFRAAIEPLILGIQAREDLLGPLIEELGKLGFDIRNLLKLIPQEAPPPSNVSITINAENANDPVELSRQIVSLLEGAIGPRV